LIADLPAEIAALEAKLEDPGLYARDPAGFDRIMKTIDAARARLSAGEEEWLALEEKREALNAR
jgi:ABC transport system ATP-binding/permease protein